MDDSLVILPIQGGIDQTIAIAIVDILFVVLVLRLIVVGLHILRIEHALGGPYVPGGSNARARLVKSKRSLVVECILELFALAFVLPPLWGITMACLSQYVKLM